MEPITSDDCRSHQADMRRETNAAIAGLKEYIAMELSHVTAQIAAMVDQQKIANGRTTRLERWGYITTTAIVVLVVTKWPEFSSLFGLLGR